MYPPILSRQQDWILPMPQSTPPSGETSWNEGLKKAYTGLERSVSLSVEHILANLLESEVAKGPFSRFKERTHDHQGFEITIAVTICPVHTKKDFRAVQICKRACSDGALPCRVSSSWQIQRHCSVRLAITTSKERVTTHNSHSRLWSCPCGQLTQLFRGSGNNSYTHLDSLLSHHWLVTWKGEISFVVGVDHCYSFKISWYSVFWINGRILFQNLFLYNLPWVLSTYGPGQILTTDGCRAPYGKGWVLSKDVRISARGTLQNPWMGKLIWVLFDISLWKTLVV